MPKEERLTQYGYFLNYPFAEIVDLRTISESAGISIGTAKGLKSRLMSDPRTYMKLVKAGYPAEKIPSWVRRPSVSSQGQNNVQSLPDEISAGTSQVKSHGVTHESGSGVTEKGPGRRQLNIVARTSPIERFEREIPQLKLTEKASSSYPSQLDGIRTNGSQLAEDLLAEPIIGSAVSRATLEGVTVRTQAIMSKVALNPSLVLAHSYLANSVDADTQRPYFEGDFGDFLNWAAQYALLDAYGVQIGVITTGRSKYEEMKKAAFIGKTPENLSPMMARE